MPKRTVEIPVLRSAFYVRDEIVEPVSVLQEEEQDDTMRAAQAIVVFQDGRLASVPVFALRARRPRKTRTT